MNDEHEIYTAAIREWIGHLTLFYYAAQMTATPRHITHNNFVYFSCPSPDRQVLILSPTLTVHSFSFRARPWRASSSAWRRRRLHPSSSQTWGANSIENIFCVGWKIVCAHQFWDILIISKLMNITSRFCLIDLNCHVIGIQMFTMFFEILDPSLPLIHK